MHKRKYLSEIEPPKDRTLDDQAYDIIGEMLLERDAQRLLAEVEREEGSSAQMSEFFVQMNDRCTQQIHAYFRKRRVKQLFTKTIPRIGHIAAMLVAAFTVTGAVAMAASETVRIEVMRLISLTTKEYTALQLVQDEEASFDVPADWQGTSYPSYIPPELELLSVENSALSSSVTYQWKDSSKIAMFFDEIGESAETNLDTEAALITPVFINDCPGSMIEKRNTVHIYWCDGQKYFLLTVRDMDRDSALRMAESVKRIR